MRVVSSLSAVLATTLLMATSAYAACPPTSMTAVKATFKRSEAGPFTPEAFTHAKAEFKKEKSRLEVYISNQDWTVAQLTSTEQVRKEKTDASVVLSFYQHKGSVIGTGTYPVGFNLMTMPRMEASVRTFQTAENVSLTETGTVTITHVDEARVCGTFDVEEWGIFPAGVAPSRLTGTFEAAIETR